MGSLKVNMRAHIGFSWQGLVWAEKLFAEGENDGQFPAVKLPGRRAAQTHPGQNSCWHQQREQNGERNAETQSKRELKREREMMRGGTQTKNMDENTPSLWK